MPTIINEVVKGALKLNGLQDRQCFTSWQDFINTLPDLVSVEVPTSVSGVVVSSDQPTEDDRDKLWVRRDNSGNFLGLYAFQSGAWHPFYTLVTTLQGATEIVWLYGDSANPPKGFTVIALGDAVIVSDVVNSLLGQYVPNGSGGFAYYAARFSGY